MSKLVVAAGVAAALIIGSISTTAGAGVVGTGAHPPASSVHRSAPKPVSWRCVVEAAHLGLLGRDVNPWNHTFVAGTEGSDGATYGPDQITVGTGEVYCGLGGDDIVVDNHGIVIGGTGNDSVVANHGTFYGGTGNDGVYHNEGIVYGGRGDDSVRGNLGFFDGGPGRDQMLYNAGTCVNVEVLSSAPPGTPAC